MGAGNRRAAAKHDPTVMSTLELQRFESVPAGDGMVLFRLAGRWPQQADANAPTTLVVESDGDTHEFDALPEPGLSGDGAARSAAFAAPEGLRSGATAFALAVGDLTFELPACDSEASAGAGSRPRIPAISVPPLRVPQIRVPALRLERWDTDELLIMATGCALGAACATALLVEIVP